MQSRILVVDDEQGIRDFLTWELSGQGFLVSEAASGELALAALAAHTFDLVISDVQMPGLTGVDVLRGVREATPGTEVIISTGHATLETSIECLRGGAFDLLQKPIERTALLGAVGRALERRRSRLETSVLRACQLILKSPGDKRLPERIVDVARNVMDADGAALRLTDPSGRLSISHQAGVPSAESTAGAEPSVQGDSGLGSRIDYPLRAGDRLVGVLELTRSPGRVAFRVDDLDRATVLASQVLLALENVGLVGRMVASERLASIGTLAAGVAHEINNPVAYVYAAQRNLEEGLAGLEPLAALFDRGGTLDELRAAWAGFGGTAALNDLRQCTEEGLEGTKRIREIASDLRTLSRTDELKEGVSTQLGDVIRSAMRVSGPEVRARATILEEIAPDLNVIAAPGRLSQVFINLFVNAAQAMKKPDGERGRIRVRAWRAGGRVLAEVSDDGPGIPSEHLGRMFEPFFTTKPAGSGTGLGLCLSREIVRGFKGELRLATQVGQGTTFTLDLPEAPQPDTAAPG